MSASGRIRIAVMVGSLRRDSYNRRLAQAVAAQLPTDSFSTQFLDIGTLPLYDQDQDERQPAPVQQLKAHIESADALLFVTPEYNRSMPGVLKNAIDHASRPSGRNSLAHKPAGILGASPGALGSALAQQHLRNVLAHLDMLVMAQPEGFFHVRRDGDMASDSDLLPGDGARLLRAWTEAYVRWVQRMVARYT